MHMPQRKMTQGRSARVLVVDDEPAVAQALKDMLKGEVNCQIIAAKDLGEARKAIKRHAIDLLVTDVMLPDGSGLSLLNELHEAQPGASAMVMSGVANLDAALGAIRGGAVDFVAKPFVSADVAQRVCKALADHKQLALRDARQTKLRSAFKRLNQARHQVSKKVDLLCNDLISAYGDLSRQLDTVRLQQSFRQFIEQARGLEQLLCHSMDWMLRQLGYSNIGIWLVGDDQDLQLGAYMKYTMQAEKELLAAMQKNLLRAITRRGFVRLRACDAAAILTPAELKFLNGQDILGINCTYLGETLAVIVLFRDGKTPFTDEDVAALKTTSPMFALALARMVKGIDGPDGEAEADPDSPADHPDTTSDPSAEGPKHRPGEKPKKPDPADWWKRGEAPPF